MIYTLTDVTEEYLAERHIQNKKYFGNYLLHSKWAFKKMFFASIYSVLSSWKQMKYDGNEYYIEVPKGLLFLFSVSYVDRFGNIRELFYNTKANVVTKKNKKCCSCKDNCGCGGACEDVNSTVTTTKLLFTINGVDYYEKDWIQYCKNGDILLWREVPTKKYNDLVGDIITDYNNDYNNDYIPPGFSNYTIVTETFQEKICSLETLPCGCPKNTDANLELINQYCGCFWPTWVRKKREEENRYIGRINADCRGTVKISPCQTRIIYNPERLLNGDYHIPDCLLLNYQTGGEDCDTEVIVPEYAVDCVKLGIDYRYKLFSNVFSGSDKKMAKYAYEEEITETLRLLNRFSFEWANNIQDAKIMW